MGSKEVSIATDLSIDSSMIDLNQIANDLNRSVGIDPRLVPVNDSIEY